MFIVTIHDKNKFLLDTVLYTSCPRLSPLISPAKSGELSSDQVW